MFKCIRCNHVEQSEKDVISIGCYVCSGRGNENDSFHCIDKVNLCGYGHVSKKRINEMKRRVILPYTKSDGGYYLGRRGENGKVQEKIPSY